MFYSTSGFTLLSIIDFIIVFSSQFMVIEIEILTPLPSVLMEWARLTEKH